MFEFSFPNPNLGLLCYFLVAQSGSHYTQRLNQTRHAFEIFTSDVTSNHSHCKFERRVTEQPEILVGMLDYTFITFPLPLNPATDLLKGFRRGLFSESPVACLCQSIELL